MSFELLNAEINNGLSGQNSGIPMGFSRLDKYVGLRKRIFTTVFGGTGTGKTAFVHNAYILRPFDYIQGNVKSNIKMKVILFSMERSKVYTLAKWLSRKIFVDQGILIPIPKLLGWWDIKLTKRSFLIASFSLFSFVLVWFFFVISL
jgi:replicative DNA helicase